MRDDGLDVLVCDELSLLLGDRFVTSQAVRDHHGRDESPLPAAAPDAVAFVESEGEVAEILRICSRERVPVIPFGAGTSLEGHTLATRGGLCLDLTNMNEIVSLNVSDLDVTVEAGVTRTALEARLQREGLFFPVDPGADATIGGMVATGASGTTTVRYGAMKENVLSLRVVLADGRSIQTGHRARKSSAGYDLTRLFLGSEGTLGVVTQVTLKVYGIPEVISCALAHFSSVADAVQTVIATLQTGIPVARVEFLDETAMKGLAGFFGVEYPIAPTLFYEFHGSPNSVAEDTENSSSIATDAGALDFRAPRDSKEQALMWKARHESFFASAAMRPGARSITTDVCVPISRLGECIVESRKDIDDRSLLASMIGHVGDGNFHIQFLVDPGDAGEMELAEEVNDRLVDRALSMGGTCTGEHGIGLRKIPYLRKELGEAVDVMGEIKAALDPAGVMNPGKVLGDRL